jgi:hypothetical protein
LPIFNWVFVFWSLFFVYSAYKLFVTYVFFKDVLSLCGLPLHFLVFDFWHRRL